MKLRSLYYAFLSLSILTSCRENEKAIPDQSISSEVYRNLIEPNNLGINQQDTNFISRAKVDSIISKKLRSGRTTAYTEHGPFTTGLTTEREIEGPSGKWNVWRIIFQGVPGWSNTTYFGRYYEHSVIITIPAGAYLLTDTLNLIPANKGYQGSAPPNPITGSIQLGYSYSQDNPQVPIYKLTTYTFVPKWLGNGAVINPNNVRLPSNFTNTTFSYKYFTL